MPQGPDAENLKTSAVERPEFEFFSDERMCISPILECPENGSALVTDEDDFVSGYRTDVDATAACDAKVDSEDEDADSEESDNAYEEDFESGIYRYST